MPVAKMLLRKSKPDLSGRSLCQPKPAERVKNLTSATHNLSPATQKCRHMLSEHPTTQGVDGGGKISLN